MHSKVSEYYDHFGSARWILMPNETLDKTPLGVSKIKHLHFSTHANIRENISLYNFVLFHLRRRVKTFGFMIHHGFQTPGDRWKHVVIQCTLYFICFSEFGTRDEALTLFFSIVLQALYSVQVETDNQEGILFTVGNVDRDIGRYSGRHSVDSRSTVGRYSVDTRSILGRQSVDIAVDSRSIVGR